MSLGEKIASLRKEKKLSQEDLAEKVGVARQTISKWELNETAPDIKQAQELAKIFHVSLDELLGNEIHDVVIEKISNTEKLAGMIIKILKVAGVIIITMIVIELLFLIAAVFFYSPATLEEKQDKKELNCEITENDSKYIIEVKSNGLFSCENCSSKLNNDIYDLVNFGDLEETKANIMEYFEGNVSCALKE